MPEPTDLASAVSDYVGWFEDAFFLFTQNDVAQWPLHGTSEHHCHR